MSAARKVNISKCHTFKDLFYITWTIIKTSCNFQHVDIIYDSYIEDSIKCCERLRRTVANPLMFYNRQLSSDIPNQIKNFWTCAKSNI